MQARDETFRRELVQLLPRLRRFGYSLTRDRDDAEDLVQAGIERALLRRDSYHTDRRLDSWVFRIMQNIWIDSRRSPASRMSRADDLPEEAGEDGRETIDTRAELRDVQQAFEALVDDHRAVLSLVVIEELSYAEAASVLHVPIGTVMSRLARARSTMAQRLGRTAPPPGDAPRNARAPSDVARPASK